MDKTTVFIAFPCAFGPTQATWVAGGVAGGRAMSIRNFHVFSNFGGFGDAGGTRGRHHNFSGGLWTPQTIHCFLRGAFGALIISHFLHLLFLRLNMAQKWLTDFVILGLLGRVCGPPLEGGNLSFKGGSFAFTGFQLHNLLFPYKWTSGTFVHLISWGWGFSLSPNFLSLGLKFFDQKLKTAHHTVILLHSFSLIL
jgi:hypothetical protein